MLQTIREHAHVLKVAASDALKARARLFERKAKLHAFAAVGYAIAAAFVFVAIIGLHVALGFAIAPAVGIPAAIAISSGAAFVLACLMALVGVVFTLLTSRGSGARLKEAQVEAADAKLRAAASPVGILADHEHGSKPAARHAGESHADHPESGERPPAASNPVLNAVLSRPSIAIGGSLVALSLIGPKRAFRMLGPGLAAANAITAALAGAREQRRRGTKPHAAPRMPRPPQTRPAPPRSQPKAERPNPAAAPSKAPRKPGPAPKSRFARN